MVKKFIGGVLIGLLVLIVALIVWKGNLSFSFGREKTITVTGTGKVNMKPEVARFTAGVQKFGSTVSEAMSEEEKATKNIVEILKGSGVKDEDIRTAYFSVWPQTSDTYDSSGVKKTQITGYSVSNSVDVKVRNVDQASNLLGKVISAGANNISGLTFGADDPKEQEAEARQKAVDDAREKAEKMAQAAGRKLGKIISISEGNIPAVPVYKLEGGGGGGGGPAVETGGLEISQTVTVIFELR